MYLASKIRGGEVLRFYKLYPGRLFRQPVSKEATLNIKFGVTDSNYLAQY